MTTIKQDVTDKYAIYNADCIEITREMPDESIGFSIFSPPFASLYTYSNSPRDMGNCKSDEEFMENFGYLVDELYRITQAGRIVAFHCMNIPAIKERDGYIGIKDFRGDLIRCFQKRGFIYHSEHVIWKDPLVEATRTKALGLLHKQLCKDSSMCRAGLPDYLIAMRKPGENAIPISHANGLERFIGENPPKDGVLSHQRWQRYASPVWMDINQTKTLQADSHRNEQDEKHICFATGTLVLTQKGYIPIEDVEIGDITLTHTGQWKHVIAKQLTRHDADVIQVKATGVPKLICTPDHKIWSRGVGNTTTNPKDAMSIRSPEWVEAQSLEKHYVNLKLPPVEYSELSTTECWLIGRYLADGHVDVRGHQFFISVGNHKIDTFMEHVGSYVGHKAIHGNCTQFGMIIKSKTVRQILKNIGKGAENKKIPKELLTLDVEHAKALLDGYMSGDGHCTKNGHYMCSSVSRSMLLGLAIIVQRVTGKIASVYAGQKEREDFIEGRMVHCKQDWVMTWSSGTYQFSKILDDGAWKPVRSIENAGKSDVWSIRVEDDASYTAEGCIVKNCPLQLDVIERGLELWSKKGDTVLSPFMGIGSETVTAVKMGRKAVGIELKEEYYDQAERNMRRAVEESQSQMLLDL